MTHSYVSRDSFICVTWLIHVWHTSFVWVITLTHKMWYVFCNVHMCDMTHSYVWHDSFICVTWLIDMCFVTFIRVTWLIHTCDMTHLYVWHDSLKCVYTLTHVMWYVIYHDHMLYDSFIRVTFMEIDLRVLKCMYISKCVCACGTACVCVCVCVWTCWCLCVWIFIHVYMYIN